MSAKINLVSINKKYNNQVVFNDFSLSVEEGEFLAISGPSGCGKTTILNIIGLLDYPDNGTVKICDVENPKLENRKGRMLVRDNISYLFQNFALVEKYTARKNLELQCKLSGIKIDDPKVLELLAKFGIEDLLDKKVFQLSGGEQQRLALVRAFIKKPTILLADEPTASLDLDNAKIVMDAIKELHKNGTTVIVVTHNPDVAQYANRVVNLK